MPKQRGWLGFAAVCMLCAAACWWLLKVPGQLAVGTAPGAPDAASTGHGAKAAGLPDPTSVAAAGAAASARTEVGLEANQGLRSWRFLVVDLPSGLPAAGVALRARSQRGDWQVLTDAAGAARISIPADQDLVHLEASAEQGFVLDTPRLASPADQPMRLYLVQQVVVGGRVLAADGEPVAGAEISLVEPQALGSATAWPKARNVTKSDADGVFRFVARSAWPMGSSLVAHQAGHLPGHRVLQPLAGQEVACDLQMAQPGADVRVHMTDESGQAVAGCKVSAWTGSSPVQSGWVADEVPAGAGGDLALVARQAQTDREGRAVLGPWPRDRSIVVKVVSPRGYRLVVSSVTGGERLDDRRVRLAAATGEEIGIAVALRSRDRLVVRGWCRDLSEAQQRSLRFRRVGTDGAAWLAVPTFETDGRFRVEFDLPPGETQGQIEVHLVAEDVDGSWRRDLGKFAVVGARELDGLVVSR